MPSGEKIYKFETWNFEIWNSEIYNAALRKIYFGKYAALRKICELFAAPTDNRNAQHATVPTLSLLIFHSAVA